MITKEKELLFFFYLFLFFLQICSRYKIIIFCLRRHILILILVYQCISVLCCRSAISRYLTGSLKYLPENMAVLVQKLSNSVFRYLKTKKKVPRRLSRGRGLSGLTTERKKKLLRLSQATGKNFGSQRQQLTFHYQAATIFFFFKMLLSAVRYFFFFLSSENRNLYRLKWGGGAWYRACR